VGDLLVDSLVAHAVHLALALFEFDRLNLPSTFKYRERGLEVSGDSAATLFLLLDFATFSDLYHINKIQECHDTMARLKLLPSMQQEIYLGALGEMKSAATCPTSWWAPLPRCTRCTPARGAGRARQWRGSGNRPGLSSPTSARSLKDFPGTEMLVSANGSIHKLM